MSHGDRYGVASLALICVSGKRLALFGVGEALLSVVGWLLVLVS